MELNVPTILRGPLVFGDQEQIAALRALEKECERCEEEKNLPEWNVHCVLEANITVRARTEEEAEEKACDVFGDLMDMSNVEVFARRK